MMIITNFSKMGNSFKKKIIFSSSLDDLRQRGNLAIGSIRFGTNDQLRVATRIFFKQRLHDMAGRVFGIGDSERLHYGA